MKNTFLEIARNIKREGMDKLLNSLEERTDFFSAPASTHYHGAEEEGLIKHSLNVRTCLQDLKENLKFPDVSEETLDIVSLFHDVCKINCYVQSTRNVKENGVWVQKPYFAWNNDKISYGHGSESVIILSQYIQLSMEEKFAIRYHMGAYQEGDMRALYNVYKKYPLAFYLHIADNQANLFLEG